MRPDGAPIEHLDEGTAHAWLDGALPPDESARVEAHVAECAECAALVAEARGLIAGASRIVAALDAVPGNVIPATHVRPARRPSSRAWMLRAAAAVVVMAGGAALLTSRSKRGGTFTEAEVALDSAVATAASAPAAP
jgi:anti-sigma factor RsiW